jgi:hypothetical protein
MEIQGLTKKKSNYLTDTRWVQLSMETPRFQTGAQPNTRHTWPDLIRRFDSQMLAFVKLPYQR